MSKYGIICACLVALFTMRTDAQGKTRMLTLSWSNLEGEWQFRTDPSDIGERDGWYHTAFVDADWRALKVPGYWEPQGVTDPRPGEQPRPKNGLVWTDYDGVAWYRLRVVIPSAWKGKELLLSLGAVDDVDRTYFNGKLVGETGEGKENSVALQRNYRIGPALAKYGAENVIAVRVTDGGGPGGITGPFTSLLPVDFSTKTLKIPQGNRPFMARFADPPADARILKIIHSWPNAALEQNTLIRQLAGQGFGGVVCNDSFTDYLVNEDRWRDFKRAITAAKAIGMALWLYDEKGYPSGPAGGLTLKNHPEYQAQGLLIADTVLDDGHVMLTLPPGKLVLAKAYPVANEQMNLDKGVDIADQVKDGVVDTELPVGKWHVMVITESSLFEGTHVSISLGDHIPYVNLLEPAPTREFIHQTHDRYAAHLGDNLGKYFLSTFTDEPSLMSYFFRPMPYRVLPWGPSISAEFLKRRGYALEPYIPAIIADTGARTAKTRYDFYQTVGEMVSENYFGQLQTWCKAHGFNSGGHLLMEEELRAHVALYGDFFRCARRLSAPSIDCLTSMPADVPWYIARLISSAAELEGRPLTMCETSDFAQVYRPGDDKRPVTQVTEEQIRGTCNRLILNGINTITSYYTFQGLSGEQLQRLNNWVGRCCTSLRGGRQVSDIAVLYPIESMWPRFRPARSGATDSPSASVVENTYRIVCDSLYNSHRDFTFIDSRVLEEAKVVNGTLVRGDLRWRVVVLPSVDTLPMKAWQNLARFMSEGGVVVETTTLPTNSESEFPSERVQALGRAMFGDTKGAHVQVNAKGGAGIYLGPGSEGLLAMALNGVIDNDVHVADPHSPIRVTHRRIDGYEIYFLINDSPVAWKGSVSLSVNGAGQRLDLATGKSTRLANGKAISLNLAAYGGVLFRFAKADLPLRHRLKSGALPGLTLKPIQEVTPTYGSGVYAPSELTKKNAGWSSVSSITKSAVDTHCFVCFKYPQPLDLHGADGLAIDTLTPNAQIAATNMLIIVVDKDGAQYIADTGRSLASAGLTQLVVPWSRFQLAGWSKDPKGRLDLSCISAINVGWGGYFGTEGEKVEFTVMPLMTVKLP